MSPLSIGVSPSGKAAVFGIAIPRFESWHPSHLLLSRAQTDISDFLKTNFAAQHLANVILFAL